MNTKRALNFYIFLILTLFGICKGTSENRVSTDHTETRILDIINDFDGNSNELNTIYISGYSGIIKERNDQITNLNILINERQKQIAYYQKEMSKCIFSLSSCLAFGNSSGIYQILDPENNDPMNVLCNSEVAGPGWIVIQQRINGREDFDRNWANYSQGFGSYDGDFFLGLEKIHRLTSSYRHELHIYIESGIDIITHAHYDQFEVAAEDDQYKLLSLGEYTGNQTNAFHRDSLRDHELKNFYTIDRDNDMECAKTWHGGWWFDKCGSCNLNGRFNATDNGVSWDNAQDIKKVIMLIRPKSN